MSHDEDEATSEASSAASVVREAVWRFLSKQRSENSPVISLTQVEEAMGQPCGDVLQALKQDGVAGVARDGDGDGCLTVCWAIGNHCAAPQSPMTTNKECSKATQQRPKAGPHRRRLGRPSAFKSPARKVVRGHGAIGARLGGKRQRRQVAYGSVPAAAAGTGPTLAGHGEEPKSLKQVQQWLHSLQERQREATRKARMLEHHVCDAAEARKVEALTTMWRTAGHAGIHELHRLAVERYCEQPQAEAKDGRLRRPPTLRMVLQHLLRSDGQLTSARPEGIGLTEEDLYDSEEEEATAGIKV